ncbi:MAG: sensor histidine kinase [Pseudomonas sp.]|uniref:sensor histidine kinase n=1 Tax=Halopseudomonas laoshanensis TaxID=2268758 RepID=UPI001B6A40A4|nr:sensor histidine kinase [Pseudomonas sp.]MBQ0778334.1 sensor histidine kinase [Pseudomonas sp.]
MKHPFWIALCFSLAGLAAWQTGTLFGYRQVERESQDESFRYSQLISNEIKRYEPIVTLAAQHPQLRQALTSPEQPALINAANQIMQLMADIVASSDVYLMDHQGLTIAASNYQQSANFIGQNFSFRPYFQNAFRSNGPAFYFALGTTSDMRGLYFAHAVMAPDDSTRPIGVIAMKIQVAELESQWRRPTSFNEAEMLITDAEGVSFLASRPNWLYRAFEPLTEEGQARLQSEQRYAAQQLRPMNITRLGTPPGVSENVERVLIEENGQRQDYLSLQTPLPNGDWTLRVMIGTRSVLWTQVRFLITGLILLSGLLLAWLYLRERQRREAELAQRSEQLERSVKERTADLKASNQQLLDEVRERERAEKELKETQRELIQAAKLAVLGQMSAGLNHEMNQPLTAIQAYARNSQRFLQRGEQDVVDANLGEIVSLCDKMAELTRQFKVFARKSEGLPSQVDLRLPIDAALKIIRAQDSSSGILIEWQRPTEAVMVHGDLIRIEQVMVNLIANAVQAVEGSTAPEIHIQLQAREQQIECRVRDNGSGLPANTEQIFEPFFTTKSMKQGLGLGLSISRQIMDALGGKLVGQNRPDTQGAEFILTFQTRSKTD